MGYSLAELRDRDATSSRYNVLLKTMEFFGYSLPQGYLLSNFTIDKNIGGVGLQVHFTDISLSDPSYPVTSWQWDFDNNGSIDSYDQNPVWTYNEAVNPTIRMISSNGIKSDTLVIQGLITINSGIMVYESVAGGHDLSGSYIRDYLLGQAYSVTYQNTLPESMEGFSAAFISFGDASTGGATLEAPLAKIITDYLQGGGNVYLEGAVIFSWFQRDNPLFLNLFGMDSAVYHYEENPIDSLGGQPAALTNEMLFTGNSQVSNFHLDIYKPSPDAVAAFIESNFGIVGVQYSVPESHRTFCFAYCLADLSDGETPNTREELLNRILNFFDIYTSVPVLVEPAAISCKVYPNPVNTNATFQYNMLEEGQVILEIYNSTGQKIGKPADGFQSKGEHIVQWSAEGLPSGIYYYSLRSGKQQYNGKIIIIK
jgi:PKD repeat protein